MTTNTAIELLPLRSRLFLELVEQVVDVCIVTDNRVLKDVNSRPLPYNRQREIKREALKRRIMTRPEDPSMPLLTYATFSPKRLPDGTYGLEIEVKIPSDRNPGEMRKVFAYPHLQADGISGSLPYFLEERYTEAGKAMIKRIPQSLPCLVLMPFGKAAEEKNAAYRVAPLGLATSTESLDKWNNIGKQKRLHARTPEDLAVVEHEWPIVEQMKHAFTTSGKRYLVFTPQCYDALNPEDKKTNEAGEEVVTGQCYFGHLFGQKVIDMSDPKHPEVPPQETFFIPQLFEIVSVREKSIGVVYQGPAHKAPIKKGALTFDKFVVDGFAALQLDQFTANPERVFNYAMRLVAGKLDDSNPLFRFVRDSKGFEEGAKDFVVKQAMRRYALKAVDSIKRNMTEKRKELYNRLTTAQLPLLKDVLNGGELAAVWYCTDGGETDAAANVVKQYLDNQFFWDSWLCMCLRDDVLCLIARKEDVSIPELPSKEAPKVEVPAEVPVDVTTQAVEAPVEQTEAPAEEQVASEAAEPPKTKRTRKNASATPAA